MKKGIYVSVLSAAVIVGGILTATFASTQVNHGEIHYDSSSIPPQVVENVGGGIWTHELGFWNSSDYYHPSKIHRTTVTSYLMSKTSSWVPAGEHAKARILRAAWGNSASWDTK